MNPAVGSRRPNVPRHVPNSANIQHAVHPPEKNTKRHASSAATQRSPIQPPVCGVQPGRALELRTNLGLMRAKQMLQQQEHLEPVPEPILKTTMINRSQLKTARLQPLGIVDDELISSRLCLGIIPASPHRQHRHQRPRSSTAPGVHFDLSDDPTSGWVGKRVKVRQRSHSAILARTVNTEHLMKLLSVSKQTALLPEEVSEPTNPKSPIPERADQKRYPVKKSANAAAGESTHSSEKQSKILPPVVRNKELVMKIEVRGIHKQDEREGDVPRTSTECQGAGVSNTHNSTKHSPRLATLPPLSNGAPVASKKQSSNLEQAQNNNLKTPNPVSLSNSKVKHEEKTEKTVEISLETNHKHSSDSNNTANKNVSPNRVTVVSIGERPTLNERPKSKNPKQRRSSGRLSLGWSPPQPIEPISGNPLSIPVRQPASIGKKGNKGQEKETNQEMTYLESRPVSSSMRININVNEFLEDNIETTT